MDLTIQTLIDAYRAILQLRKCRFAKFSDARRVETLYKLLQEDVRTAIREEQKLFEAYGCTPEADGTLRFAHEESRAQAVQALANLHGTTLTLDWTRTTATICGWEKASFTPAEAAALDELLEVNEA